MTTCADPLRNTCTKALPGRSRPPIILRTFDRNLPICFAESSFANETLNKNGVEHDKAKLQIPMRDRAGVTQKSDLRSL
jgi:hypothetical protein